MSFHRCILNLHLAKGLQLLRQEVAGAEHPVGYGATSSIYSVEQPKSRSMTADDRSDDVFETVQRQRRKRLTVAGNAVTSSGFKGAPEPSRDLFIYRIHTDTNVEHLPDFLKNKDLRRNPLN